MFDNDDVTTQRLYLQLSHPVVTIPDDQVSFFESPTKSISLSSLNPVNRIKINMNDINQYEFWDKY